MTQSQVDCSTNNGDKPAMKLGHAVFRSGRLLAPVALLVIAGNAVAASRAARTYRPRPQVAGDIFSLHDFMLIICGAIFVLVFGVMFYSIWKHRR